MILYIVGTPIGNLSDITFRAIETLKNVSYILCENINITKRLLLHYGIDTPLKKCHRHNEHAMVHTVITALSQGHELALVSDSGTPSISDPGQILVREVQLAGFRTIPIPGVSALTSILSINPFHGKTCIFEGFLPKKSGKRLKRLKSLLQYGEICIIYESPYRLCKLLSEVISLDANCRGIVARELTKIYEDIRIDSIQKLFTVYSEKKSRIKGECTVLLYPSNAEEKFIRRVSV